MITAEYLRSLLIYNPETGEFAWATSRQGVQVGDLAGTITHDGYRDIRIDGRRYRAHRLAWLYMTGGFPSKQIDHDNLDRADNRWRNLREATQSLNNANRALQTNNRSGLKGVSRHQSRWRAQIKVDGVKRHICVSECPAAAYLAYVVAADKVFGQYARVR